VLAGAFMLVRKSVLDKVGSFDTSFFMYGEDVDLSYRIQKAGFINRYFAQSTIIHFKGESTQKASAKYIRNFYGAMALFVEKHYAQLTAFIYKVIIRLVIILKQITAIFAKHTTAQSISFQPEDKILLIGTMADNELLRGYLNQIHVNQIAYCTAFQSKQDIIAAMRKQTYQHIIFTAGTMPYQTIIDCLQNASPAVLYWIRHAASKSMVSSSDKNRSGSCVVLK
ncbi:MAG: glycosyltransferase family 2 protein, partial [Ferruginibacter sp.]